MITVRREGEGHVAELVLDRPEAMNAISTAMAQELGDATRELAADPQVRCVVVTSSHEKAFCVGADLKERNGFSDADLHAGLEIEDACWRATAFSPDRAEGVRAFAEKRAPRWPGA